ncbi:MAG: cyclic nucleotide-binding domain-containing protein [Deltaproteobacteria bacterium]|nr:cyclic nucleotide-binding domain-containing protein [Deltaproteobacteria bacterium]
MLEELAVHLEEESFAADSVVIREGDIGDKLYLVTEGRAEVQTEGETGPIVLATLGEGELFGEIALLHPGSRRSASIVAVTPLKALTLAGPVFATVIASFPETQEKLKAVAEKLLIIKFLKQATPFTTLEARRLELLASRLEKLSVPAEKEIIRQGERGDCCFLIQSGRVEVIVNESFRSSRQLATLEAGALFGEAAILSDSPRNATIRSLQPCELFILKRSDLLEVMGADWKVASQMVDLLRLRDRPRRIDNVQIEKRKTDQGEKVIILKDPKRGAYFKLSPEGWFVWERLDGNHNLKDIIIDYFRTFKTFSPQGVTDIITSLVTAGFAESRTLRYGVLKMTRHHPRLYQGLVRLKNFFEWRYLIRGVDRLITVFYRRGMNQCYRKPVPFLLTLVAVFGLVAFVGEAGPLRPFLNERATFSLVLALWPLYLLSIVIHEAGHAFTTKAFGREVLGVGLGWYWVGPIVFVDTSDMWLAPKWPRIRVGVAGVYTNLVVVGLVMVVGVFWAAPLVKISCWFFALISYLVVLLNLNPTLDYDGYYILSDLFERPHLRQQSFRWFKKDLFRSFWKPSLLAHHFPELFYGFLIIFYYIVLGSFLYFLYRFFRG